MRKNWRVFSYVVMTLDPTVRSQNSRTLTFPCVYRVECQSVVECTKPLKD